MSRRFFGTDGVRGVVNREPMTVEFALNLGRSLAHHFSDRHQGRRPKIVLGKDTRLSGYMLEEALCAGLLSQGADVNFLGPLPTPGVAFMTVSLRADAGAVISASHNPYQDNGIKLFARDGFKLPDEEERRLEYLLEDSAFLNERRPASDGVGRAERLDDAAGRYVVFLKNSFPKHLTLEGLTMVVDCANGAAYKVAPMVFEELGATVHLMGDAPDGFNINDRVGSLYPGACAQKVLEVGADFGLSLDGDADRAIFVDEKGQIVDGDQIMNICARRMKKEGRLAKDAMVATVMSNMGLELALARAGIKLLRSAVGDRYVVEMMREGGYNFGGEQSGHLIFLDHGTTGDGILAALQTLTVMLTEEKPLSELAALMEPLPQILINVKVSRAREALDNPFIMERVEEVAHILEGRGRILLRPSGTEPLVRVMLEGDDKNEIERLANQTADYVEEILK